MANVNVPQGANQPNANDQLPNHVLGDFFRNTLEDLLQQPKYAVLATPDIRDKTKDIARRLLTYFWGIFCHFCRTGKKNAVQYQLMTQSFLAQAIDVKEINEYMGKVNGICADYAPMQLDSLGNIGLSFSAPAIGPQVQCLTADLFRRMYAKLVSLEMNRQLNALN